jgi:SWI/SNF-related matrix-associated actin-dependent regulator of chromatin subfamily A member 5
VEEKIIERQTVKLKWDSLVIQQSKTAAQKGNKNLTKEEMKDMLQFGASTIIKATKGTISDE